jgi:hypothetical protein
MDFHYVAIGKDGYIEVFQNDQLYLRIKQTNYFRSYYTFFKKDKIIFKSRLTYFAFWRSVKILYQDLECPIAEIQALKLRDAELWFNDSILYIESHLLNKKQWILYNNGLEIGWIKICKGISVGGKFDFHIDCEEETVNLYFLILFASSLVSP